jgi:hypothetical protein
VVVGAAADTVPTPARCIRQRVRSAGRKRMFPLSRAMDARSTVATASAAASRRVPAGTNSRNSEATSRGYAANTRPGCPVDSRRRSMNSNV